MFTCVSLCVYVPLYVSVCVYLLSILTLYRIYCELLMTNNDNDNNDDPDDCLSALLAFQFYTLFYFTFFLHTHTHAHICIYFMLFFCLSFCLLCCSAFNYCDCCSGVHCLTFVYLFARLIASHMLLRSSLFSSLLSTPSPSPSSRLPFFI